MRAGAPAGEFPARPVQPEPASRGQVTRPRMGLSDGDRCRPGVCSAGKVIPQLGLGLRLGLEVGFARRAGSYPEIEIAERPTLSRHPLARQHIQQKLSSSLSSGVDIEVLQADLCRPGTKCRRVLAEADDP